ncbi:MAG: nuclear transport factor 2 family protein [Bacteroidetes bacterium]|nr:nuclear transport factor 2 family protein [Bacteroidota bacterium]
MKIIYSVLTACGLSIMLLSSCQKQSSSLTEEHRRLIADSAIQIAKQVIDFSNNLDFKSASDFYSADADARYIENGVLFPSLDAMLAAYAELAPTLDVLENKPDKFDALVLSKDAVSITAPIHIKIKAKELSAYNGQYLWSVIMQKRNGKWLIVQSHESWLNYAEVIEALTPKTVEKKK